MIDNFCVLLVKNALYIHHWYDIQNYSPKTNVLFKSFCRNVNHCFVRYVALDFLDIQ